MDEPRAEAAQVVTRFSVAGIGAGFVGALPIGLSVGAYGLVWGVLAGQTGLSPAEVLLMSGIVFAGSAQFVALGLWATPLPVGALILTTLVINLRHLLLGAALRPWFARLAPARVYPFLHWMTDENWALTLGYFNRGGRDAAYMFGSGLLLFCAWPGSTLTGRLLGGALPDPARFGLDFAGAAVFLSLVVGFWRGRRSLIPWLVAAASATMAHHFLSGAWYVPVGALAGSLVGLLVPESNDLSVQAGDGR